MEGYKEAPQLDNFFSRYKDGIEFCSICLKTNTETKLVYNTESVKAFAKAIKMHLKWKNDNICYICEVKAIKALQFFRSLAFASAIDKIFFQILLQKRNNIDVFQNKNFSKIIDIFGFPATRRVSSVWEAELASVRNSTTLKQTKIQVFGVEGNTLVSKKARPPRDMYVIPDKLPLNTDHFGAVTEIKIENPHCDALNINGNYRTQSPDTLRLSEDNMSQTPVPSSAATPLKALKTLVCINLDDEDNEQSIKIAKVESQAPRVPGRPPALHPTPRLVPIENLLEKPPAPKIVVPLEHLLQKPKEVLTGDSLLLTTPNGPLQLHPIAIKEGVTLVPSLDAKIVDGVLIFNKPVVNFSHNVNVNESSSTAFSHENSQNKILNKYLMKEVNKRDSEIVEMATPVKKSKVLPTNEEHKNRIDWEDKIPMDVISFVDAVDPNPLIETPKKAEPTGPHMWPPVERDPHTRPPDKDDIDPDPLIKAAKDAESRGPLNRPPARRGKPLKKEEFNPLSRDSSKDTESIGPLKRPPVRRARPLRKILPKIENPSDIIDLC